MRESRLYGSVRGARGNSRPYRELRRLLRLLTARLWQILLQKSFSTADQNFSSPLVRFADKYVGDLVSS